VPIEVRLEPGSGRHLARRVDGDWHCEPGVLGIDEGERVDREQIRFCPPSADLGERAVGLAEAPGLGVDSKGG
jgi:hypothetical protein